jgi:hypothetical protein
MKVCQFVDRFFGKLELNCNKTRPIPIKLFAQSLHRAKTLCGQTKSRNFKILAQLRHAKNMQNDANKSN